MGPLYGWDPFDPRGREGYPRTYPDYNPGGGGLPPPVYAYPGQLNQMAAAQRGANPGTGAGFMEVETSWW